MACKILSKVLSDKISSACSTFDVLYENNFSVLKDMTTQSPIFAIGSVVKDALEKNRELWLVLQNMYKAYDLCIFYDLLLCKVKRQESVYGYRLNFYFISKTGRADPQAGLTSFFAASAFVDNMIWVGSSQAATQHILNVVSEFFRFNNISINNDKTVAIPINCRVTNSYLTISGLPISITKKEECHHYLGIFLSTEGLSRPSLVKVHMNVQFFANFVLKKVVSDKQFAYLVSAVLFLIVYYRTQFSYVSLNVCNKWNAMICKGLKSKAGLPFNFPNDALHHSSLYGLRTFEQIQTKSKSAFVLSWHSHHSLQFPVCIKICLTNNFLAKVVHIFSGCDLSLGGSFSSAFHFHGSFPMSFVLGEHCFSKYVFLLHHYGIAFVEQLCDQASAIFSWNTFKYWKRLDLCGLVPFWFDLSVQFLSGVVSSSSVCLLSIDGHALFDVLQSHDFGVVCDALLNTNTAVSLSVYMDGFLSGLGTVNIHLGLGIRMFGMVSSMLAELQAIALVLECISPFRLVDLFSDSQVALDACESESLLIHPDFRNWCWIKCHYIIDVIRNKNLNVNWVKIKDHLDVLGNEQANALVKAAASSSWWLLYRISKCFLRSGGSVVSGNLKHFVCDVFRFVNRMRWEVGSGFRVVVGGLCGDINWSRSSLVWHSDSHMAVGSTSAQMAGLWTYFIKALYHQLPVAMYKHLYNRHYLSMACLFCGDVKVSDHVFFCSFDAAGCSHLMNTFVITWETCSGLSHSSSCVSQLLSTCTSDIVTGAALCKSFESVSTFKGSKVAITNVVNFVRDFCIAFQNDIWLVHVKHHAVIERNGLIPHDGFISVFVSGFSEQLLSGIVRLLGVAEAFGVGFGFCKSYLFFSGTCDEVLVHIGV
ncbi:hypothetical protein G9A89_014583 [Geosiphon pyriformis]|nr:hypothetical protein G9A89_014583 [Geosiphon pyriformis]